LRRATNRTTADRVERRIDPDADEVGGAGEIRTDEQRIT